MVAETEHPWATSNRPPELTCMRCKRPVGRIGLNSARPYSFLLTEGKKAGVGPICRDEGSCTRARMAAATRAPRAEEAPG